MDRTSPEYLDSFAGGELGAKNMGVMEGEVFCRDTLVQFIYAGGYRDEQERVDRNKGCRDGWLSVRPDDTSIKH